MPHPGIFKPFKQDLKEQKLGTKMDSWTLLVVCHLVENNGVWTDCDADIHDITSPNVKTYCKPWSKFIFSKIR